MLAGGARSSARGFVHWGMPVLMMVIPSTCGGTGVCAQEMIPLLEASRTEEPTLHIASYWYKSIVGGTLQYSRTLSHVGLTPEERVALIDRYGAHVVQKVLKSLREQWYDKDLEKRAYASALGGSWRSLPSPPPPPLGADTVCRRLFPD